MKNLTEVQELIETLDGAWSRPTCVDLLTILRGTRWKDGPVVTKNYGAVDCSPFMGTTNDDRIVRVWILTPTDAAAIDKLIYSTIHVELASPLDKENEEVVECRYEPTMVFGTAQVRIYSAETADPDPTARFPVSFRPIAGFVDSIVSDSTATCIATYGQEVSAQRVSSCRSIFAALFALAYGLAKGFPVYAQLPSDEDVFRMLADAAARKAAQHARQTPKRQAPLGE